MAFVQGSVHDFSGVKAHFLLSTLIYCQIIFKEYVILIIIIHIMTRYILTSPFFLLIFLQKIKNLSPKAQL